jgi:hypothetical protein
VSLTQEAGHSEMMEVDETVENGNKIDIGMAQNIN